jgi:6-phosphogluconolactonase (cycloisomerase 2 family)
MVCLSLLGGCTQGKKTNSDQLYLLIGCYSDGTTPGISVYDFNVQTGNCVWISDVKEIINPSYLAISKDEQMVYAVNETNEGGVSALKFDKPNGALSLINAQAAYGNSPCYINVDSGRHFIVTANYGGGNLSVFPLNQDGSIKPVSMNINMNTRPSVLPDTAPPSHIHTVVFTPDEKYLLVTDLGKDSIYRFAVVPEAPEAFLQLLPGRSISLEKGSGPRHLAFHPSGNYLYCINELSGTITVFSQLENQPVTIQTIVSDTVQTTRRRGSADIHLTADGRWLYASNRATANDIAIFAVNPQTGLLTSVGHQSTGAHPRNFIITPNDKYLLCANMNSNNIQLFEIDSATGLLHNTGRDVALNKPVCMKWVTK